MLPYHTPVLLNQVIRFLVTGTNGIICDCTVGDGGHSMAILEATSPRGRLIGIDRDREAIDRAGERLAGFGDRVTLIQAEFADLEKVLSRFNCRPSGFLFDLGVSSFQIGDPNRGFSYIKDGPLDMRMDRAKGKSAWHLVNELPRDELSDIIKKYGEERVARTIAGAICRERMKGEISTTAELSLLIRKSTSRRRGLKSLSRTFQALRIAVNDELSQLESGLVKAAELLPAGGRIVVISYHSLEDRIVKETFKELQARGLVSVLTKKVVKPTKAEISENRRARSAKLRVAERL